MKKNYYSIVFLIVAFLLATPAAIAPPSDNPADYFFYDNMEGGSMTASYTTLDLAEYSTTVPYPGGTKSIQANSSPNVNIDNAINSSNFTSAEYTNPYCLSYQQYDTGTPASNAESGWIFNSYANILTNRDGGTANNATFADNAAYYPFGGAWSGLNTWYNITVCFTAGYAASGTTTAVLVKNGINYRNVSSANKNSLLKLGIHNRVGATTYIGLVRIWNYTQYDIAGPQQASPGVNIITAELLNNITTASIGTTTFTNVTGNLTISYFNITASGFCATLTGNGTRTNCTTGGSVSSTFYNTSITQVITSHITVVTSSYQSVISIITKQLFTNNTINVFNATLGSNKNTTSAGVLFLKALNGSNNIKVDVSGNYSLNVSCAVNSPFTTNYCNATGIYDNVYTIGANILGTGISNFSVSIENSTLGGLLYNSSTTNGSLVFQLLQGFKYYFLLDPPQYNRANVTLAANASTQLYNFSIDSQQNTIYMNFYNETSNSLLTNATVYVQLISDTYAINGTTTTGTTAFSLLTPASYTIRYWIDPAVPRDYYLTLVNQSFNNVSLYVVDTAISNIYLPVIVNENTAPVSGAIVKLLRYYVSSNSYQVVEMEKTDTNGQAVLRVVPNVINYKLLVTIDNNSMTTAPTKFTDSTNTYTINLQTNPLSAIFSVQGAAQSFTYNNATQTFTFTWNDLNSVITQGCMNIQKFNSVGTQSTAQSSCSSGATGSIIYTVTDTNNTRYIGSARVIATTDSTYNSGIITADYTTTSQRFGINGWLVAFFFFLALISLGIDIGTRGVIITGVLSILGMGVFGFIPYTWETIIGIMIVGVIILYKVRS